jgi:hypothetical protein
MKAQNVSDDESMQFVIHSPELMLLFMSSNEDMMKKNKILEFYKTTTRSDASLTELLEDAVFASRTGETIHQFEIMMVEANKFITTADIENLL